MTARMIFWVFAARPGLATPAGAVYLTAAWSGRSGGACGCTASSLRRGSGALGAELAEKAAVAGSGPLLGESSVAVEAEDVHGVHDDPGTGGFEAPGGRLRERLCERSFDPCLARDVLALGDDDSPPDGAGTGQRRTRHRPGPGHRRPSRAARRPLDPPSAARATRCAAGSARSPPPAPAPPPRRWPAPCTTRPRKAPKDSSARLADQADTRIANQA